MQRPKAHTAGQAGVEIKCTPAMIKAGVDELLSYSDENLQYTDSELVVRRIFDAMIEARESHTSQVGRPRLPLGRSAGQIPEVL